MFIRITLPAGLILQNQPMKPRFKRKKLSSQENRFFQGGVIYGPRNAFRNFHGGVLL